MPITRITLRDFSSGKVCRTTCQIRSFRRRLSANLELNVLPYDQHRSRPHALVDCFRQAELKIEAPLELRANVWSCASSARLI